MASGKRLHRDLLPELDRLAAELDDIRPDFVIAFGVTALWALTGWTKIGEARGAVMVADGRLAYSGPLLATFHPAAILRQFDNLPLTWADLRKAKQYVEGTLPAPLERTLWLDPTDEELADVYQRFGRHGDLLGVDIETAPGCEQITCISFGTATECICIPIWDKYRLAGSENAHDTVKGEAKAWRWIIKFANLLNPKSFQNGLYDLQYLLAPIDIRVRNLQDDTAVLSHALQPELPKRLGVLASLYLNEPLWKQLRVGTKEVKADE